MRKIYAMTLLCGAIAAAPALGAEPVSACAKEPDSEGMRARMTVIRDQADRIEGSTDRAEQRKLMELNIKHVREGVREMRHRTMGAECRMEVMASLMEAMVRHELLAHQER